MQGASISHVTIVAVGSVVVGLSGCLATVHLGSDNLGGGDAGRSTSAGGSSQSGPSSSATSGHSSSAGGGAGGGSAASSTSSSGACLSQYVDASGYVTVGTTWQGFGWTTNMLMGYTVDTTCTGTTTISPSCDAHGCSPAFDGHMTGTLAPCADSGGFADLGWNLAQPRGVTTPGPWSAPASGGVSLTFTNPNHAEVRVVISASGVSWCYPLTSGVEIPWGAFVTNCWAGGYPQQTMAPGTPLLSMAVEVVGNHTGSVPFDICLQKIEVR